MDIGGSPGRLLIIGGAEDRCCGAGVLERFARLCGGDKARIVMITTATGLPGQVLAEYEQVFSKLGVKQVAELPISGRADADSRQATDMLNQATGVFFRHARDARDALHQAVTLAAGGAVLFVYEKLATAMAALDALEAAPWPQAELAAPIIGPAQPIAHHFAQ